MAAPYVTSLAAMIYAYQDNVYPAQVKELIINTMRPLDSLNGLLINPGIPDADAAICSLTEMQADTNEPFLVLETSYDKETICVHVAAYDVGGSGIRKVRYAYGSKPAEYFTSATTGTAVIEDTIYLTKGGYYTFYVEDYAGNYSLYNNYIEDDTIAPDFTASYRVAPNYANITVFFSASDSDSGVKAIKYLAGEFNKNDFLFSGESLDPDAEQHTLTLSPEVNAITFYVTDYRGNSATYTIYPVIIPATSLYLNVSERSLIVAETFCLQPLIFPWLSTDGVYYSSMDNSVIVVDTNGIVTAVGAGEAYVQVTTHSGISALCRFVVTGSDIDFFAAE